MLFFVAAVAEKSQDLQFYSFRTFLLASQFLDQLLEKFQLEEFQGTMVLFESKTAHKGAEIATVGSSPSNLV